VLTCQPRDNIFECSTCNHASLHFARVIDHEKCTVVTCVCVSVCLSPTACLHYCTDPDVTCRSGRGCPLVVHYWPVCNRCTGCVAMATQHYGNAWQSPAVIRQAHHTPHTHAGEDPLAGNKTDAPAAHAVPFHPYCRGVVMRTQNVSVYMLVLTLCLVCIMFTDNYRSCKSNKTVVVTYLTMHSNCAH